MDKPAAIQGSLVDAYNVNTHKVLRLEIDVPVELAGDVLQAFGWPTMVNPVPVAIARLNAAESSSQLPAAGEECGACKEPARQSASSPPLKGGPLAKKAAMMCNHPLFGKFMGCEDEQRVDALKTYCGLQLDESRRLLDHWPTAGEKLNELYDTFQLWLNPPI